MNAATVISREISYLSPTGGTLVGYLATPEQATEPLPAVLVCPEWWGSTDYIKQRTQQLAQAGYAAFAIDLVGDGKITTDATQAKQWMQNLLDNQDNMLALGKAGLDTMAAQPEIDDTRLAAIGFCFGAKVALDLARDGCDLKAVVTFHGILSAKVPAEMGKIKGELLVLHGADDTRVTMDKLDAFKQEMDAAQANYQVIVYPHAKHAFSNPVADERARDNGVDLGYDAQAAQASNQAMLDLLQRVL